MAPKTSEYLARVREKTGLSDYAISKKYSINQSNLSNIVLVDLPYQRHMLGYLQIY